jgi:hypothetical protein
MKTLPVSKDATYKKCPEHDASALEPVGSKKIADASDNSRPSNININNIPKNQRKANTVPTWHR